MANINLIPTDLAPKGSVVKLTTNLKSVITVGFIILIIFTVAISSLIIINIFQLQAISRRVEALKSSVTTLEETEQRYVLLKDRLRWVKEIYAQELADKQLTKFESINSLLPANIRVTEMQATNERLSLTISSASSSSLVVFMSQITENSEYENISLSNFSYSSGVGYTMTLVFQ